MDETLIRFVENVDRNQQQDDCVEKRRKDLRAQIAVGLFLVGRALRKADRQQRKSKTAGIGKHVRGIGQKGKASCEVSPRHLSADYKRRLWAVIAINAAMFLIEMGAGALAGSRALQADALDFLGDSLTYGISLAVIGAAVPIRAWAAFAKGVSLTLMGLGVFGWTAYHVLVLGVPRAEVMGAIGFLALAANVSSVLLLAKYKDGDANVRSVWLCSRNDAIGNVAVMVAALGVWGTATKWPDLLVAAIMAALFLYSSVRILQQATLELRTGRVSSATTHQHVAR